jgi:hypothetical protein
MSTKRKCTFSSDYEKIDGIKKSRKGDAFFYCVYCAQDINLESMGKTAITQHQASEKHKNAVRIRKRNQTITDLLPATSAPAPMDYKVAAAEGNDKSNLINYYKN